MYSMKESFRIAVPFLLLACMLGYGCGRSGGTTALVQAPPAKTLQKTVINIAVQDASTGALVSDVTLTLSGATFINGENTTITSASASGGITTVYVKDDPAPAAISIRAGAAGYIGTTQKITIDTSGVTLATISLLNVSTAGSLTGVAAVSQSASSAGGTTVTASDTSTSQVTVTVPAASAMKDSSGAALSGNLNVTVAYVDQSAPIDAALTLPTTADTLFSFGGTTVAGSLMTVGAATITITDANGKVASQMQAGTTIPITITVPATTLNPGTGAAVRTGDTLDVYSFSDSSGIWTFEGSSSALVCASGTCMSTYNATHLSGFHFGGFVTPTGACPTVATNCPSGCGANIFVNNSNRNNIDIDLHGSGYNGSYSTGSYSSVYVDNVPKNTNITISASYGGGTPISHTVSNFCNMSTAEKTFDVSSILPTGSITVTVNEVCKGKPSVITPVGSSGVTAGFYLPFNSFLISGSTNSSGKVTLSPLGTGS